jgi:predicted  nucleic acid-binding Zn-ribbon protein
MPMRAIRAAGNLQEIMVLKPGEYELNLLCIQFLNCSEKL